MAIVEVLCIGIVGIGLINNVIEVVNIVKVVKDIIITLTLHKGCVQSVHPF